MVFVAMHYICVGWDVRHSVIRFTLFILPILIFLLALFLVNCSSVQWKYVENNTLHCTALQIMVIKVQCGKSSAVQCSWVCSVLQCSGVLNSVYQSIGVMYSVLQCSTTVPYSAVQCSVVKWYRVYCSAVVQRQFGTSVLPISSFVVASLNFCGKNEKLFP